MKYITYQQYVKYLENKTVMLLKEEGIAYQITEEKNYSEEVIKEIDKRHDKMFRNVLSRKKEMVNFLNEFLDLKEKIEETQIIQCPTDFITRIYKNRQSDILYKLKDKPVYFLVEHQSTIHQEMLLRIWEYIGEIVRMETVRQNTYFKKDNIYPIVIPIVIYTGFQKMNKIIEIIQDPKDKEALSEIIVNIIKPIVGKEKTEKMLEKINEKEVQGMSPFTKFLLDYKYEILEESEKAKKQSEKLGMEKGMEKGIKKAIKEMVKNMMQFGESDEKIMKYIGINKEELENIKGMLSHS